MSETFRLSRIARLPLPGDNVAIAIRRLDAGTKIMGQSNQFTLDHTVLEGHRFAVQSIETGEELLSWNLPFGEAIQDIVPGTYVCNESMLEALRHRRLTFDLPQAPNFKDKIKPYVIDEETFQAAKQVSLSSQSRTFKGYRRQSGRGVGTRNFIVLMGTTSRTASYVRQLETRLDGLAEQYSNIDGIVAVAHTEGGNEQPNNLNLLLRTLAGFMIHPNVGAILAVDYGLESVTNRMLKGFMSQNGYPLEAVPHQFLSLEGSFQENLTQGETIVKGWLDRVNHTSPTDEPVSRLKIALQCGGSDAFSGISGNPLASWVAKEVIRYGGSANLAETDELIGAESYVLQKVADLDVARQFLMTMDRFKQRAAWHGTTAEGNPSGGNKFRGLYNIVLKSIGAAMKRHPDVRLDAVIKYGERMINPGYYFMDSPGNDLESVAGQVAAGCNMIFFVTGNGSITNFPFVPTLKIVTTTRRYELLSRDMDVNAGAYLGGRPMDELGQAMFELTLEVASGRRSVGEQAGHAQVQIWRNWRQTDGGLLEGTAESPSPTTVNRPVQGDKVPSIEGEGGSFRFPAIQNNGVYTTDQIGLILPTSLCAGQIAQMTADRLNRKQLGHDKNLSRFVALVHTEGCGVSSGQSEELYIRTMLGYLSHPQVKHCLLLEHGCEKTHNDYMRHRIEQIGLDPGHFGWASVQLDGGIENAMQKIEDWFSQAILDTADSNSEIVGLEALRLGLVTTGPVSPDVSQSLVFLTKTITEGGGTVVIPRNPLTTYLVDPLELSLEPTALAYGQRLTAPGLHLMDTPTTHWVENLAGLGATGVEIILACVTQHPMQSHPMVPMFQVTAEPDVINRYGADIDLVLGGDTRRQSNDMLSMINDVISHHYTPKLFEQGNIDFQITRGLLGISL